MKCINVGDGDVESDGGNWDYNADIDEKEEKLTTTRAVGIIIILMIFHQTTLTTIHLHFIHFCSY